MDLWVIQSCFTLCMAHVRRVNITLVIQTFVTQLCVLAGQRVATASTGSRAQVSVTAAAITEAPSKVDLSQNLSLDFIRQSLIRQEDTIIFSLIERAQFSRNAPVYQPSAVSLPGGHSLLEFMLRETEQVHGKARRYTSPEEQAFYPQDLPPIVLPPIAYPEVGVLVSANDVTQPTQTLEAPHISLNPGPCPSVIAAVRISSSLLT